MLAPTLHQPRDGYAPSAGSKRVARSDVDLSLTRRSRHHTSTVSAAPHWPDLLAGVAAGQAEAREKLARLLYGRVSRLARHLCARKSDAEDVAQQVLIEVLRDAPGFRFEGAFERWVDRITIRRAMRAAHLERRRREALDRWSVPGSLPWGVEGSVRFQESAQIDAVLSALSPDRIDALILHHGLGYSVKEVSGILNTPIGTVKDRLVNCKKQLRAMLRDAV